MWPIGRQCASGLSFMPSAIRFFLSSAAQGCIGAVLSGRFVPMSKKVASGGRSAGTGGGASPPRPRPPPPPASQMPDKSGFPSAVLGVGAVRLGFPSANLGILGVVKVGHCANTDGDIAATTAINTDANALIPASRCPAA